MNMFDKNLRYFRKKQRLTIKQLAKLVGVSKSTIIRWEKGLTRPSLDYFIMLCKVLNVSANILLK